jgi:hypothetical protein
MVIIAFQNEREDIASGVSLPPFPLAISRFCLNRKRTWNPTWLCKVETAVVRRSHIAKVGRPSLSDDKKR